MFRRLGASAIVVVAAAAAGLALAVWLSRDRREPAPAARPAPPRSVAPAPAPMPDEPPPPLQAVRPAWPMPPVSAQAASLELPPPPLDVALPRMTRDEGLAEPAAAAPPASAALVPDGDAAFARRVLDLRREGLDIALLVQLGAGGDAGRRRLDALLKALPLLFPRARVGAVVYSPSGVTTVPLGAAPRHALAALEAAPAPGVPGQATGLADALKATEHLDWEPRRKALVVLVAAEPPWIAEVPPATDSARRLVRRIGAGLRLFTLPLPRPAVPAGRQAPDASGFDRFAADEAVSRTTVGDPSALDHEVLAWILGPQYRPHIEALLHEIGA